MIKTYVMIDERQHSAERVSIGWQSHIADMFTLFSFQCKTYVSQYGPLVFQVLVAELVGVS